MDDLTINPKIEFSGDWQSHPLAKRVGAALERARAGEQPPGFEKIVSISGMSGKKYRAFINLFCGSMPGLRYLEVGCWAGSTLCSAINGNKITAVGIDNWSEFGGPRDTFFKNLSDCSSADTKVDVIESDFRKVDFGRLKPGRFDVYLFDGPHHAQDQMDGISMALPALSEDFVLIVDDWNFPPASFGTTHVIKELGIQVICSVTINTTLDGSIPAAVMERSDWHNGYMVAVCRKPARSAPKGPRKKRG